MLHLAFIVYIVIFVKEILLQPILFSIGMVFQVRNIYNNLCCEIIVAYFRNNLRFYTY